VYVRLTENIALKTVYYGL